MEVLVAALQMSSQADVERNLDAAANLVMLAKKRGAELAVLPENFALMGENEAARLAIAEDKNGPIVQRFAELARSERIAIVLGGFPERSELPACPYNTSVYLDQTGKRIGTYRKIHMFDVKLADGTELKESASCKPGDTAVLVRDGQLRVGMTICYDLRFPELYRALTSVGANVITVPAAFTLTTGKDHWHTLLRARAIENQVYVLAAAQHGRHPRGRQTYGKALIADPWGDVLAQAPEGEGMALAAIDLERLSKVRRELPCLLHRTQFHGP